MTRCRRSDMASPHEGARLQCSGPLDDRLHGRHHLGLARLVTEDPLGVMARSWASLGVVRDPFRGEAFEPTPPSIRDLAVRGELKLGRKPIGPPASSQSRVFTPSWISEGFPSQELTWTHEASWATRKGCRSCSRPVRSTHGRSRRGICGRRACNSPPYLVRGCAHNEGTSCLPVRGRAS